MKADRHRDHRESASDGALQRLATFFRRLLGLLLQRDRLTLAEEMNSGGWCQASNMVGEGSGWKVDQIATLGKSDRPPGSPVHGDGVMWLSAADGFCRLLGVEMALFVARNDGRSPTSDRHQCYVDIRHLLQPELRTCVPRIPPSA